MFLKWLLSGIKEDAKRKTFKHNCNFIEGTKPEKDMVKLVPLQPYLIESVPNKSDNQCLIDGHSRHISFKTDKSSIYHPLTNRVNQSSRIIYKKCEPGSFYLFYLPQT